mmetsp:Transcript_51615/g.76494  ORF Transcript_51615/g.76494 Transcript_51615/m.76494 type:complete len:113 (+) Transcript_51615:790-1128(+)
MASRIFCVVGISPWIVGDTGSGAGGGGGLSRFSLDALSGVMGVKCLVDVTFSIFAKAESAVIVGALAKILGTAKDFRSTSLDGGLFFIGVTNEGVRPGEPVDELDAATAAAR